MLAAFSPQRPQITELFIDACWSTSCVIVVVNQGVLQIYTWTFFSGGCCCCFENGSVLFAGERFSFLTHQQWAKQLWVYGFIAVSLGYFTFCAVLSITLLFIDAGRLLHLAVTHKHVILPELFIDACWQLEFLYFNIVELAVGSASGLLSVKWVLSDRDCASEAVALAQTRIIIL